LLKERRDFFETRVTGREETWAAVKLVCELLEQNNLTDAQAVLDAAGCTCPSGDLWGRKGGVYDEFGEKYVVPSWVIAEPPDVIQDGPEEEEKTSSNEEEEDEEELSREKGKGKATVVEDPESQKPALRVRARLSHNAQDVIVRIKEEDKVRVIIRKIRELANVCVSTGNFTEQID
jgi:Ubiquitin-binding domain